MIVSLPTSLNEALGVLFLEPDMHVLAGGTDFMVEVNYNQQRPEAILSLRFVDELREWHRDDGMLVLGAGVRFSDIMETETAILALALAQPARTVGSPQFRNTGTICGNVATAPPAGNTLPVLSAPDAIVNLNGVRRARSVSISEFVTGVKKTRLALDELIRRSAIRSQTARRNS